MEAFILADRFQNNIEVSNTSMYTRLLDFRFWHAINENSDTGLDTTYGILWDKSLLNITVLFSLFLTRWEFNPRALLEDFLMAKKPTYEELAQRVKELRNGPLSKRLADPRSSRCGI